MSNSAADNRAWYHVCMVFQVRGKGDLRITEVGVVGSVDPEVFARVIAETDHGADIEARLTQAASDAAAAATTAPSQTQADALAAADAPSALNPYVTGTNWSFLRREVYVTPEDKGFDAVGDGKANDLRALQAVADYAIDHSVPLRLTPGHTYDIADGTWVIGNRTHPVRITIHGTSGNPFAVSAAAIHGTTKTAPIVAIQGLYDSTIGEFFVYGENTALPGNGGYPPSSHVSDYISAGYSNTRYTPQCGVALDPFTGRAPPGGGYAGFAYGKPASNSIEFKRLKSVNSVIGFWIAGGVIDNALASNMRFHRCSFGGAVAFSSTSSQARNISLIDIQAGGSHTSFDTCTYGSQNGAALRITRSEISYAWRLFNVNTLNDVLTVDEMNAEACCTLGAFVGGAPCLFRGCAFDFYNAGYDPIVHALQNAPMHFLGCGMSTNHQVLNFVNTAGGCALTFEHGGAAQPVDTVNVYHMVPRVQGSIFSSFVTLRNCRVGVAGVVGSPGYNTDVEVYSGNAAFPVGPHTRRVRANGLNDVQIQPCNGNRMFAAVVSGVAWSGATLTFAAADPSDWTVGDVVMWQAKLASAGGSPNMSMTPESIIPDDISYTGVAAVKVSTIVGSIVTAVALGDASELRTDLSPTTLYIVPMTWAPIYGLTGTWSSAVKSLTLSNAAATMKPGYFVQGNGLPANTRVISQAGAAVVLSKSPTLNKTNEPIFCSRVV